MVIEKERKKYLRGLTKGKPCIAQVKMDHSAYNAVETQDIATTVSGFVHDNEFLFFALACSVWHGVWHISRSKRTAAVTEFTTVARLRESFSLALKPSERVSCAAAKLGRVDLLSIAVTHGCPIGIKTYKAAAGAGQLYTLRWLEDTVEVGRAIPAVCTAAARGGHLSALAFLRASGFVWDLTTCCQAAKGGFEEIVTYCLDGECTSREEGMIVILHNAARSGDVGMLARLVKRFNYELGMNDTVMRGGVESGHVRVLEWVRGRVRDGGYLRMEMEWDDGIWRSAAYGGNIETLSWGWEFAKRADVPTLAATTVTSWAALGNHIGALRWLHKKGFPFGVETWNMGTRGCNETIVSFLRDIGSEVLDY